MRPQSLVPPALAILLVAASPGAAPDRSVVTPPAAGGCLAPCLDILPRPVMLALQSVVRVRTSGLETHRVFRGGRFQNEPVEGLGAGSGVIVSEDGTILTNAHVVDGGREVIVELYGGREVEARVVSIDAASDLALLRIPDTGQRPVAFAGGGLPESRSPVYLAGNPGDGGLQISWARIGEHRRVRVGARPIEFWCEFQGTVSPGDSGGALLDSGGRLVGIAGLQIGYAGEALSADSRQAGLFIPAAHVVRSLRRMLDGPVVEWPFIGLLLEDPLLAASDGKAWSEAGGVRVRSILPGSPASRAGFRRGDRLLAIGSRPAPDNFEALDATLDLEIGRPVTIGVERTDRRVDLTVTPAARPADPRPEPLDDFALHTGLRLEPRFADDVRRKGRVHLLLAGLSQPPPSEPPLLPELIARGTTAQEMTLGSILPGQDLLVGQGGPVSVASGDDLAALLPRCFVKDQFVAVAHWSLRGQGTVDQAHVHRKIHPVVL